MRTFHWTGGKHLPALIVQGIIDVKRILMTKAIAAFPENDTYL